jgi:hypothetical protein
MVGKHVGTIDLPMQHLARQLLHAVPGTSFRTRQAGTLLIRGRRRRQRNELEYGARPEDEFAPGGNGGCAAA